jgi:hypothetical protein
MRLALKEFCFCLCFFSGITEHGISSTSFPNAKRMKIIPVPFEKDPGELESLIKQSGFPAFRQKTKENSLIFGSSLWNFECLEIDVLFAKSALEKGFEAFKQTPDNIDVQDNLCELATNLKDTINESRLISEELGGECKESAQGYLKEAQGYLDEVVNSSQMTLQ